MYILNNLNEYILFKGNTINEINSYNDPYLIKADVTSCELYLVITNFISL